MISEAPSPRRNGAASALPVLAATVNPRPASIATAMLPTPPVAPVTSTVPAPGVEAVVEQREDRQRGGVARGADDHRLASGQTVGQRHDPSRRHPRHLRVPTVLGDAEVVAVRDHAVARGDPGGGARPHRPGEVDAGHDRRDAGDPALLGGGQVVLVVDARPLDVDDHVALGQVVEGQLGDPRRNPSSVFSAVNAVNVSVMRAIFSRTGALRPLLA